MIIVAGCDVGCVYAFAPAAIPFNFVLSATVMITFPEVSMIMSAECDDG